MKSYFISYPRSGRTYFRFLYGCYIQKLLKLDFDKVLDITTKKNNYNLPLTSIEFWSHLDGNAFENKNVELINNQISSVQNSNIILITRNILDTCVSRYFYYKNRYEPKELTKTIQNMSLFDFMVSKYGIEHCLTFYKNLKKYSFNNLFSFTYENLSTDTPETFIRILTALEIEPNMDFITYAIQESKFELMRKYEMENKFDSNYLNLKNYPNENAFYKTREGHINGYLKHFSKKELEILNQLILE